MKLLTLCGFLLIFLLCFNAFTGEGRKVKKICCSKLSKLNKKSQKEEALPCSPTGGDCDHCHVASQCFPLDHGLCFMKYNSRGSTNPKMTLMEKRKYCKPCPQAAPPVIPGPLPQLK